MTTLKKRRVYPPHAFFSLLLEEKLIMITLVSVLVLEWILASIIGTGAYFASDYLLGAFTSNKLISQDENKTPHT